MSPAPHVVVALVAGPLLACAASATPTSKTARTGARPEVVLLASGYACGNEPDIRSVVSHSMSQVDSGLDRLGFASRIVSDVTAETVRDELQRPRARPVVFVYSGHGGLVHGEVAPGEPPVTEKRPLIPRCPDVGARCTSLVCLADGWHTVDGLISQLSSETPYALFVLDACTSADVDPRLAPAEAAVLSLSRERVNIVADQPAGDGEPSARRSTTLLGVAAGELAHHGVQDRDCDGAIDDIELSRALAEHLPRGGMHDALPTLRRQARSRHRLGAARVGRCVPDADADAGVPRDEPYSVGSAQYVRLHGFVSEQRPAAVFAGPVDVTRLIPTACQDYEGQCFRAPEDARR